MAWLAVNKNGTELITPEKPVRVRGYQWDYWEDMWFVRYHGSVSFEIELRIGSIYRLLGLELRWDDEPVELK